MKKALLIALITMTTGLIFGQLLYAQTNSADNELTKKFHRKIYVPFESLDIILDGNSNRALLSRDEYDALLKSSRTREIKRAPLDSAIVSAKYIGKISDGVAFITGELIVESLNDGLVQIPLPFSGVAIRSATLGDNPAKLWRNEKGQIVLLTSLVNRETLRVEMTVPLQTSAARQSMGIQLPAPSATQFNLEVPGNVEVKSGVPVVKRIYEAERNVTKFDLLATRKAMNIVMSLNNRLLKNKQVAVSRSVVIHKLTPHEQEIHVTCSMDVIHGALEEVQLTVPNGFEVSQVTTDLLSQWEIIESPKKPKDSSKRLLVKLREPTREDFVLNIVATRNIGAVGEWKAVDIRPIDVAGHVSVVGVLADLQLQSTKLVSGGVIAIDHEFLLAAIPQSLQATNRGNPAKIVAAYYAPQKDYSISASFLRPSPELIIKSTSRLVIDDQSLKLQGGISLISRHDSRLEFKLTLPKSWRLNELTGIDGRAIRYDRLGEKDSSEFLVHLPAKISSTSSTKVFFEAAHTPEGWLEKWESNQIEYPTVKIDEFTEHTGAIAISTTSDLAIKPANTSKLKLLDEADKKKYELDRKNAPLAYQFESEDFQIRLDLERIKPSIIARTYNYAVIRPTQMLVHAELIYDVKQASESEFKFDLPLESPKSISIRAKNSQLKDYQSKEIENARRWTVQLAKPKKEQVHLLIDFQMPLEESDLADLKLAPVIVRNVSFQSSMFAIEGSNELDIEIETKGRPVDVGEFSQAVYQPGRHLLGAYSWPNEDLSLSVKSVRRPVYQLPSAIVQRAEMVTAISNSGKAQTAARFQFVTKQQSFLRVELPQNAKLWSVQLDGQSAKPQRQNEALLISLIGNEPGKLRDLQLVFESPGKSFNLVGTIDAHAPTLWLNKSGDADGIPVPLVDLHWRLIMPDGFSVSHSDGKFQSDQLVKHPSPIQQLGNWVFQLGGGIGKAKFGAQQVSTESITSLSDSKSNPSMMPSDRYSGRRSSNGAMEMESIMDEEDSIFPTPFTGAGRVAGRDQGLSQFESSEEEQTEVSPQVKAPPTNQLNAKPNSGPALTGKRKSKDGKEVNTWALSGLGSLNIELTETGNSIEFYNLGDQPTLTATVINQYRLNWIAIALALLIAAFGVLLTNRQFKSKVFFVALVLLVACLVPFAGTSVSAFRTIIDLAILSGTFVTIYFVVAAIVKSMGRSVSLVAARAPFFLLLITTWIGFGVQVHAQEIVKDVDQLRNLITEIKTKPKVELPKDAIIIPFDADDPKGRENADRLLLPYQHYLNLINQANSGAKSASANAPVDFVISSAEYNLELTLDEDILIQGKLVIDLLTDDPVIVPLPLLGGALADAKVDGTPAKLQFQSIANAKQKLTTANSSIVQLHIDGRGTKTFEFAVQIKPVRQGGWRLLNARLPVGMSRGLNLTTLNETTEVRLNSDSDRRSIEAKPDQQIKTVLSADGSLRLQWKPSTAAAQTIEQSLTVQSEAVFDVREDGLRLTWRADLEFKGSERDVFTLNLPDGFLVEKVSGENIRAWDVSGASRLNLTTLSPAKDKESFIIELSKRDFTIEDQAVKFEAPYLGVEGAALHQGVYMVRRSPIVELKTTKTAAVSRIDENRVKRSLDIGSIDSKSSPLGIEMFQVYQFITTPFQIGIQASMVQRKIKAETQSILRVGQTEADLEMRINVEVGRRALYMLSFDIPKDIKIESLTAGLDETYTQEEINGIQRVQLYFPTGVANDFSIIFKAELTDYSGADEWSIPKIKINDTVKQNGFIVIQVDPALTVATDDLKNCETVLLQQVEDWLNRSQQTAARVILRTDGSDYDALLRFAKIEPRVTVETVTNVRTTLFAIEETILLDFNIQKSGIRQIQFELPAAMRKARINAKLVSETIIEEVTDNANAVRVTLKLQDEVIDSFRVVIENDRPLSESRQSVPIPRVLTGVTEQRFATLQNTGRDEISVLPLEDFDLLNRQLNQFAKLKQKLAGGEVTMAYVAQSEADWPVLQYETKKRDVFDTVAARIEFSKTTMVVDSSGAYRALQNFQVNNRSEQYLEIELPSGAQLLTVLVEGQPIKPVAWPAAQNDRRLRIPLVKSQIGDLDYPVQLKYAGRLGELTSFNEIEFPIISTLNINVQLSQLHLRLPNSHRWMNFGGTMTKVDDDGKLEESYLDYKSRQIQQLTEQIQSKVAGAGSFSKSRAYSNLQRLKQDMVEYGMVNPQMQRKRQNGQLFEMFQGNNKAIDRAEQIYQSDVSRSGEVAVDNRANFNNLIESQSARIGRNLINKQSQNFEIELDSAGQLPGGKLLKKAEGKFLKGQAFDSQWLDRNQLNAPGEEAVQQQRAGSQEGVSISQNLQSQIISGRGRKVDDSITYANPANSLPSKEISDKSKMNGGETDAEKRESFFYGGMGGGGGFGGGGMNGNEAGGQAPISSPIFDDNINGVSRGLGLEPESAVPGKDSIIFGSALSSLDIKLPERGIDFYFKSPRGKAQVVVRPIESQSVSRWISLLITLSVCVGGCLICWMLFRLSQNPILRWFLTVGLLLVGVVSLALGILPVYGLLAVAGTIALIVNRIVQTSWLDKLRPGFRSDNQPSLEISES